LFYYETSSVNAGREDGKSMHGGGREGMMMDDDDDV